MEKGEFFIPRGEKGKKLKMRRRGKSLIIDWSPLPRQLHPVFPSLSQILKFQQIQ